MPVARTILVSILVIQWIAVADLFAGDPLEDLLSATFRITDGDHSGTCFFVTEEAPNSSDPRRVILATAAHVLAQMSRSKCDVILRTAAGDDEYKRKPFAVDRGDGDKPLWSRLPETMSRRARHSARRRRGETDPAEPDRDGGRLRTAPSVGQETWVGCSGSWKRTKPAGRSSEEVPSHPIHSYR